MKILIILRCIIFIVLANFYSSCKHKGPTDMQDSRIQFRIFTQEAIEKAMILDEQMASGDYTYFRENLKILLKELSDLKLSEVSTIFSSLYDTRSRQNFERNINIVSNIQTITKYLNNEEIPETWLYEMYNMILYFESKRIYGDDWIYLKSFTFDMDFLDNNFDKIYDDLYFESYRDKDLEIKRIFL
jgi:hypothetical protein